VGVQQEIESFVRDVVTAMGLDVEVTSELLEDGSIRADVQGAAGELLVRRKGEALDALQHLVNSVFRDKSGHGGRIVVDCLDFRRGKDVELRQMTRFMMDKAKTTGEPQEMGPLNSYARRLVHLEVSSDPALSSESQGDGQVKTVIISLRG
jgi:spoIIIJ-associated protein